MNPANRVRLIGKLTKTPKCGQGPKAAWAFATLLPNGARGRFDFRAFKAPAETLATLGEGSTVRVEGHLEMAKPKDEGGKWELVVVADEVHVEQLVERPAQDAEAID